MNANKHIFIVGHAGAGKGLLGTAVSKKLGWVDVNLDYALEPATGLTMNEILGEEGAKRFLDTQLHMLKHQLSNDNVVVILDDVIVFNAEARQLLKDAFTIYAEVSPEVQTERLNRTRPYLPVDNYLKYITSLHQSRDPLFKEVASITVNTDDGDIDEHVRLICDAHRK